MALEGMFEIVFEKGYQRARKMLKEDNKEDLGMFLKGDIAGIDNPAYIKGAVKAIIDYLVKSKGVKK